VATPERRYGGITLGGIIVIAGIVLIFIWSFWIGLVVALIGLIGFGGFARGKWYSLGSCKPDDGITDALPIKPSTGSFRVRPRAPLG
jgi:hypothetical protein